MSLSPQWLLPAVILLPVLAAAGIAVTGRQPNLREGISLVGSALLFALVIQLLRTFPGNGDLTLTWWALLPGLTVSFSIEPLGLLFALIASSLWFVTTLYAIGYMRGHQEQNQTRFFSFFAIAIAAVMAIAFADNLFTLFVFYEVLTLCTYPLVTHAGTDTARQGGRVYLGILLSTSIVFFLPAMIAVWLLSGTLDFVPGGVFDQHSSKIVLSILLALFAFGIGKAALMPIHRWLPAAMVAPTPVSALLHAVAVVKAGVFTVIKVVVFVFGIDTVAELPVTPWLVYLAGASILLASIVAMRQDNFKSRLAYSTVSQLGYITLGAFLASQTAVLGSAMHITMHAFGKITLFFCAGAVYVAHHKTRISELDGLGRAMPITFAAFTLAALSIIGLPPLGGVWSKWFLMLGALDSGYLVMLVVLAISSLLNIVYLLEVPARAFLRPAAADVQFHEAPASSVAAIVITAVMCIALFFMGTDLYDFLRSMRFSA